MRLGPFPWATDDPSNLDQTAVPRGSFPNEIPVGGGSVATACSGTGAGTVIGGYAKYVDSMRLGRKFDGRGLFLLCGESFPVLLVTFESYFESFEMSLWKDSGSQGSGIQSASSRFRGPRFGAMHKIKWPWQPDIDFIFFKFLVVSSTPVRTGMGTATLRVPVPGSDGQHTAEGVSHLTSST